MEIEDKFISPFSDIIEEADDIDKTTGELTEKGIKKMNMLESLCKLFEDRNKIDNSMLEKLKKRLDETYDLPESQCQEELKTIIATYQPKRAEELKEEDQYSRFTLRIDLNEQKHRELMDELSKRRTPAVHTLSLGYIGNDYIEQVLNFLEKGFPNKLEALIFNFAGRPESEKDLLDLSLFIDHLVDKSLLIVNEIQIWNCLISSEVLNKLVVHFSHVKKFWICWSKFTFETPVKGLSFEMAYEPKIEEISFEGCGNENLNNWGKNYDSLEAIIRAFSRSDIKQSISQVLFDDCELDEGTSNDILSRYDIKNKI